MQVSSVPTDCATCREECKYCFPSHAPREYSRVEVSKVKAEIESEAWECRLEPMAVVRPVTASDLTVVLHTAEEM